MHLYDESLFEKIIFKSKEILSNAFKTEFTTSKLLQSVDSNSKISSGSICSVAHSISAEHSTVNIKFKFSNEHSDTLVMLGSVEGSEIGWLESLARLANELILKEIEFYQQEDLLTDYASQISRDFEELVWTREFAKRIQETDIRNSLGEFVGHIFPTLRETVQTAQLILLQYNSPISKGESLPNFREIEIQKLGLDILDDHSIQNVLSRYAERSRKQPVVCNHCASLDVAKIDSFILVPVQAKTQEFGWMMAINRIPDQEAFESDETFPISGLQASEFGSFEAGLMQSTASFLASHVNNASLYAEKEDLLIGIVKALANAIDAKDHYTRGHSSRVASIAKIIAKEMKLPDQVCEEIHLAGLLHDVGKIGVPDQILLKKDKLSDSEMDILKQHPVIGYQVLKHLKQIAYILPGVLHHHESLDGTGYPDGLIGDTIPLPARIIAVADSFDAMTSDRPYRKGMPIKVAEGFLLSNEGPQWDPSVIDALFSAREKIYSLVNHKPNPASANRITDNRITESFFELNHSE